MRGLQTILGQLAVFRDCLPLAIQFTSELYV